MVRFFDVAGNSIVRTLSEAHTDFVRSIASVPGVRSTALSGGYDFKVRLFDFSA